MCTRKQIIRNVSHIISTLNNSILDFNCLAKINLHCRRLTSFVDILFIAKQNSLQIRALIVYQIYRKKETIGTAHAHKHSIYANLKK